MANRSMGEIISTLRKERNMTQRELAEKLNVTDKAVSKWERGLSCPDVSSLPKLAEALGVPVETLLDAAPKSDDNKSEADKIVNLVLKAVPLAMGIAVIVGNALGKLDISSAMSFLGIGLFCLALYLIKNDRES
ncbi:MAG: helix-turn-helix domain-containing protein [Oscillospiraceae bacterium]